MIGSRRWRSISFWTNWVGTDSNAKPSVSTSGCTMRNQARCWAVSVVVPPRSPFSSATTLFQMSVNDAPGLAVNDDYPLGAA